MQKNLYIRIRGAKTHNLKNIDIDIKRNALVVVTGVSGSGKSSLAFDTIYAEGQRRYVESLTATARQFISLPPRPEVDLIDGLSPSIALEQKTSIQNPRSIVGTITDIFDYIRVLYARYGVSYCPYHPKEKLSKKSVPEIKKELINKFSNNYIFIYGRVISNFQVIKKNLINELRSLGFLKIRLKLKNSEMKIFDIDNPALNEENHVESLDVMIDRLKIKKENERRLSESLENGLIIGKGKVIVVVEKSKNISLSDSSEQLKYTKEMSCPKCEFEVKELNPINFSFNRPQGACKNCNGLGFENTFDLNKVIAFPKHSLESGAIPGWDKRNKFNFAIIEGLAKKYCFSTSKPFDELNTEVKKLLLYGENSINKKKFDGILTLLENLWKKTTETEKKNSLENLRIDKVCSKCSGSRLNTQASSYKLVVKTKKISIADIFNFPLTSLINIFKQIETQEKHNIIVVPLIREISDRLDFLIKIGLGYLTLGRESSTLSGGELQRIRLATQIGAKLSGVTYILDEPSAGLHAKDNHKLISALLKLRDLGNTVIVVEHDRDTIRSADQIIDLGPGAGNLGGKILFSGNLKKIISQPKSLTGKYLNSELKIPIPKKQKIEEKDNWISLTGAKSNNLKNISLHIPLGGFICVTGVSGSGKSTLVNKTLVTAFKKEKFIKSYDCKYIYKSAKGFDKLDKLIKVDQKPIGKSPRSNPATYSGIFSLIREIFAASSMAKERGYSVGRFSFNSDGGRCDTCQGEGFKKTKMHFLPDVFVVCDICKGSRFNSETLEIRWKGKNIADVLDLTIQEAQSFFKNNSRIERKLKTLIDVGLNYIQLGQSALTLSGGEAQRIKLATELSKMSTGKTLYILDEPTTGLHFDDINVLLKALQKLNKNGNTVLIIEHNLDVIKTADWVIDLGPEGGENGGEIIFEGPPEEMIKSKSGYTAKFLKSYLKDF